MGELSDAVAAELAQSRLKPDNEYAGFVPKGWETPIRVTDDGGWLVTDWRETAPTMSEWDAMLVEWDVDTTRYEVDDTVPPEFIGWNGQTTEYDDQGRKVTGTSKLRRFKCRLRLRRGAAHRADIDALCRRVAKRNARKPAVGMDGVGVVVALGDWQLGKGEGGGTPATVEYLMHTLEQVAARVKRIKPSVLFLAGMGDKVEGCNGWYSYQAATIDLNQLEQERLARHIQLKFIDRLSGLVPVLKVSEAASNHGENRGGRGGAVTDPVRDNRDIALHEQVAEILERNPERYGHVHMVAPDRSDPLVTLVDVAGVPVAVTHGHQIRGARPRISEWWKAHMASSSPIADAQILLLGHRHHLAVSEEIGRTWVQVPASDGGSEWFTAATGHRSPRGVVLLTVGEQFGSRGWGSMEVIGSRSATGVVS